LKPSIYFPEEREVKRMKREETREEVVPKKKIRIALSEE